tara:strand:+ start:261 stop:473 length:213 start_codon:yes stop_codon:yes gene_type:complete
VYRAGRRDAAARQAAGSSGVALLASWAFGPFGPSQMDVKDVISQRYPLQKIIQLLFNIKMSNGLLTSFKK